MMKRWQKKLSIIGLLGVITVVYLNGTRVLKIPGLTSRSDNGGYLMDLGYFAPQDGSFNQFIFGSNTYGGMNSYVSLMNDYDMKRNYGLLDAHSEAAHNGQLNSMARSAFGSWQGHQMKSYGKKIGLVADDALGLRSLRDSKSPVLLVGLLAAVYTGRMLRFDINSDIAMESQTHMDSQNHLQRQYVGWRSHALDASAGASYSNDGQASEITLRKRISSEVSVNYGISDQNQSVGIMYSKGF
jgi:hypothetical protein